MLMVLCMDFFNIKIYSDMFIMVNGYYNTWNAENEYAMDIKTILNN